MKQQKILIEYLYDKQMTAHIVYHKMGGPYAEIRTNKTPIGVMIAIGPGILGWSLLSKLDKWDKQKALDIAMIRAEMVACINTDDLTDFYTYAIPFSLGDLAMKMNDRSIKYFQIDRAELV